MLQGKWWTAVLLFITNSATILWRPLVPLFHDVMAQIQRNKKASDVTKKGWCKDTLYWDEKGNINLEKREGEHSSIYIVVPAVQKEGKYFGE